MSRGRSTAARYDADNGPVVFGVPGLDVRWNRESRTLIVCLDNDDSARWSQTGEIAEMLVVALAHAHRQGRTREALRAILRGAEMAAPALEFYRCGKLMCWRPTSQLVDSP